MHWRARDAWLISYGVKLILTFERIRCTLLEMLSRFQQNLSFLPNGLRNWHTDTTFIVILCSLDTSRGKLSKSHLQGHFIHQPKLKVFFIWNFSQKYPFGNRQRNKSQFKFKLAEIQVVENNGLEKDELGWDSRYFENNCIQLDIYIEQFTDNI